MNVQISPETSKLIEARMKHGGYASPDEVVRFALQTLQEVEGDLIEDLDQDTQDAIARAETQSDRGEGRPWEEVKAELRARLKQ